MSSFRSGFWDPDSQPLRRRSRVYAVAFDFRVFYREKLPRLSPPTECHLGEGFVSVVVPAYNEGDGIKLTLSTIDEQAKVCVSACVGSSIRAGPSIRPLSRNPHM